MLQGLTTVEGLQRCQTILNLAKLLTPTVAKIELNQFEHVFFFQTAIWH